VSTEPVRSDPKPTINLVEVGPRDGLQSESEVLPPGARAELISRLVDAGARRIEVVSFVNPAVVPQMAEAEAVLDELGPSGAGVSYIGLVLNERGLDRALATSVDEINFVVAAADGYNRSNQGVDAAVTLRAIETMVPRATEDGRSVTLTISVAFGDPYDGEVGLDRVVHIASRAAATGVREIALGDTIGVAVPTDVAARFTALQAAVPEVTLRAHFHNTRNAGLANLYAAVASGVDVFDTSVGGIGGSPFAPAAGGNVATEDALFFLSRLGMQTGQDPAAVVAVGEWLGERLARQLPAAMQRVPPWPPDQS
jgi:hydroxymethylglutaryl-CoA lyase